MNLYRLKIFLAVAQRLSYSRAAEDLLISQPAVSRHVATLEKELRAQLLGQSGNRVFLTETGRTVFGYAQRLFGVEEELVQALAKEAKLERGFLRLGASSTPGVYLLPPIVAAFQDRYPGVDVSLLVANSREIETRVLDGELDLGFVGMGFQPGLQSIPYTQDQLVIIAPPSHPVAYEGSVPLDRLLTERWLLREIGSGTRRVLEDAMGRYGFRPSRTMELAGCEAVKRGVMAGMGIAAVSGYAVGVEMRHGLLRVISVDGLLLKREITIVSRKDVCPTVAAITFTALAHKLRPPAPGD